MVEICGGEFGLPVGCKAPGAIVEAFAGNVDIVAVEHAMDKACRKIGSGEVCGCTADEIKQLERMLPILFAKRFGIEVLEAISGQFPEIVAVAEKGQPLKGANPNMPVAEARQHRGAGRGGFIAALERISSLEKREALRGIDAKCLEHLSCKQFANAPFQRQPAVGMPAIGRLARTLGAKVKQSAVIVAQLSEGETPAIPDFGVLHSELMSVVPQTERMSKVVQKWFEPEEVAQPG